MLHWGGKQMTFRDRYHNSDYGIIGLGTLGSTAFSLITATSLSCFALYALLSFLPLRVDACSHLTNTSSIK